MDRESNSLNVHWNWVDEELASIKCPYCGNDDLVINIYEDDKKNKCICGKQFVLHQSNWIEEIYS